MLLRRRESEGVERQAVLEFEAKDAVKLAKEGGQTPHNQVLTYTQEEPLHSQSGQQGCKSEEQGARKQRTRHASLHSNARIQPAVYDAGSEAVRDL